jgi:hypothetical protein
MNQVKQKSKGLEKNIVSQPATGNGPVVSAHLRVYPFNI